MADDETFNVNIDLADLAPIDAFADNMGEEEEVMLNAVAVVIVDAAVANTWMVFEHPTGELAGSIAAFVASSTEVDVEVGVPYGRRQEEGGGNLLDSLGRRMTNKARPYLQPAIDDNQNLIREIMCVSVSNALGGAI